MHEPGAGEQVSAGLMNGECQDAWFVVKRGLDAIAVVGIEVEVQHACLSFAQRGGNRDGRVVVDAESGGLVTQGMVESARRMECVLEGTVEHAMYGVQAATSNVRRGSVHPDKRRRIARPEPP